MMDRALLGLGNPDSIDAYIKCTYLNYKLETKVITAGRNQPIDWNQEFLVNL